jgi:hypothetical protein
MSFLEPYNERRKAEVIDLLSAKGSKPILFLGSGFSIRYCSGPSWDGLLQRISEAIGETKDDYTYVKQKYNSDFANIGSEYAERVFEWAWKSGKNSFPVEYFKEGVPKDLFLKSLCANIISGATEHITLEPDLQKELELFQSIAPHAIITTNFDDLIERLYPEYECVYNEQVIKNELNNIGEIIKVHGCIHSANSIVVTAKDYEQYARRRKYITAKMMIYFAEHPVFIFGYSLADSNIKKIISDIGEAAIEDDGMFDNIYFVEWHQKIEREGQLREEIAFPIDGGELEAEQVRIKALSVENYEWLFETLRDAAPIDAVKVATLRKLKAHLKTLVADRSMGDSPEFFVKVAEATEDSVSFSRVLGFGDIASSDLTHPYTLSQAATKLGIKTWQKLNIALKNKNPDFLRDVKSVDSALHQCIMAGKMPVHKYSEEFLGLAKEILEA